MRLFRRQKPRASLDSLEGVPLIDHGSVQPQTPNNATPVRSQADDIVPNIGFELSDMQHGHSNHEPSANHNTQTSRMQRRRNYDPRAELYNDRDSRLLSFLETAALCIPCNIYASTQLAILCLVLSLIGTLLRAYLFGWSVPDLQEVSLLRIGNISTTPESLAFNMQVRATNVNSIGAYVRKLDMLVFAMNAFISNSNQTSPVELCEKTVTDRDVQPLGNASSFVEEVLHFSKCDTPVTSTGEVRLEKSKKPNDPLAEMWQYVQRQDLNLLVCGALLFQTSDTTFQSIPIASRTISRHDYISPIISESQKECDHPSLWSFTLSWFLRPFLWAFIIILCISIPCALSRRWIKKYGRYKRPCIANTQDLRDHLDDLYDGRLQPSKNVEILKALWKVFVG